MTMFLWTKATNIQKVEEYGSDGMGTELAYRCTCQLSPQNKKNSIRNMIVNSFYGSYDPGFVRRAKCSNESKASCLVVYPISETIICSSL